MKRSPCASSRHAGGERASTGRALSPRGREACGDSVQRSHARRARQRSTLVRARARASLLRCRRVWVRARIARSAPFERVGPGSAPHEGRRFGLIGDRTRVSQTTLTLRSRSPKLYRRAPPSPRRCERASKVVWRPSAGPLPRSPPPPRSSFLALAPPRAARAHPRSSSRTSCVRRLHKCDATPVTPPRARLSKPRLRTCALARSSTRLPRRSVFRRPPATRRSSSSSALCASPSSSRKPPTRTVTASEHLHLAR